MKALTSLCRASIVRDRRTLRIVVEAGKNSCKRRLRHVRPWSVHRRWWRQGHAPCQPGWSSFYHWLGVQQHSALVEACLSHTAAPRLVQSYRIEACRDEGVHECLHGLKFVKTLRRVRRSRDVDVEWTSDSSQLAKSEKHYRTYLFVFLLQFGLRRAAAFVSSLPHLFSAVAKRLRDASCLSVVSFNSTKRRAQ